MTEPTPTKPKRPKQNPALKLALELGPLVLFFLSNAKFGIFIATGVLMVGVVAALAVSSRDGHLVDALGHAQPLLPVLLQLDRHFLRRNV